MPDDWTEIVSRHTGLVVGAVRRIVGNTHDTEDVVQEVFAEAYALAGRTQVRNWTGLLRRLATLRALDCLRARRRAEFVTSPSGDVSRLESASPEPHEEFAATELADRLRAALGSLPAVQAQVFALRYFDEMSYEQIAAELNVSVNAVGLALHKARRQLQSVFDE